MVFENYLFFLLYSLVTWISLQGLNWSMHLPEPDMVVRNRAGFLLIFVKIISEAVCWAVIIITFITFLRHLTDVVIEKLWQ